MEPDASRTTTNFSTKTATATEYENQGLDQRIRKRRHQNFEMLYVNIPAFVVSMIAEVNSFEDFFFKSPWMEKQCSEKFVPLS
jgi:hypothetical protein